MSFSSMLLTVMLAAQAAPATAPNAARPLPAELTCIFDGLPTDRPMVSLEQDGAMQQMVPFIAPADRACVARHAMNEAMRNRALRYAFIQHELAVSEPRLRAAGFSVAMLRGYVAGLDNAHLERARSGTLREDDVDHMMAFLESRWTLQEVLSEADGNALGQLVAFTVLLLIDEADVIAGRSTLQ